jgi:hypothetical protein
MKDLNKLAKFTEKKGNMETSNNEVFDYLMEDLLNIIKECETIEEIKTEINEIEFFSYCTNDCFKNLYNFYLLLDDITKYNEEYFGFSIFDNIFIVLTEMYQYLLNTYFDYIYDEYNELYTETLENLSNNDNIKDLLDNYKKLSEEDLYNYYENDVITYNEYNFLKFDNQEEFILECIKDNYTNIDENAA